jgi:hypothetical protein
MRIDSFGSVELMFIYVLYVFCCFFLMGKILIDKVIEKLVLEMF